MVDDADNYQPFQRCDIIGTIRNGIAEFFIGKVVHTHLLGAIFVTQSLPSVLEIPDEFLTLKTSNIDEVLCLVAWIQQRNHRTFLSNRKSQRKKKCKRGP